MPLYNRGILLVVSIFFVGSIYKFWSSSEDMAASPTMKRSLVLTSMLGLSQAALVEHVQVQDQSDIRMNQIQVVGTHNSYHREINITTERDAFERFHDNEKNLYYSHTDLDIQLDHQSVRSLELDLHSDVNGGLYADPLLWRMANLTNETIPFHSPNMTKPGLKVFHVTDGDPHSVCHTFLECLWQLRGWSERNPGHLPILIDLELKMEAPACGKGGICDEEALVWSLERILNVDSEIRSVLSSDKLIVPDDVRQDNLTLEESVLQHGWPTLESSRDKFMFFFDNEPDSGPPALYTGNGHESLQNRTVFTNGVEGQADAAFIKKNDPTDTAELQRLVRKGYIIRTRADIPIDTVLNRDTTMRDLAFESAAQIVSTDYPAYGMSSRWDWDYAVQLPGRTVARCNPVSAPEWCEDSSLE